MKRLRLGRDVWLLLALFILIGIFSAFIALRQREFAEAQAIQTRYSSHGAQGNGTLALYMWLDRMGYRVERIENRAFQISDTTRVLFVLGPIQTIEQNEAAYILQWVARGNTLIVADNAGLASNNLFRALSVEPDTLAERAERVGLTQPLVDASVDEMQIQTFNGLAFENGNFTAYAQAKGKPVLARVKHGDGIVWISSAPALFTNQNLNDEDNARVVAALVANLPRASGIAFDEYHLGLQTQETGGFIEVLYDTPWGWGVLFAIVAVFFYLAVNGQRFGRVMPIPKTLARRSPSEYVTSMANLFRRANKRGMVLYHYRHSLKRRLGRPYHLNPELGDERYIEMLTRLRPEVDRAELVRILNTLRRTDISEAELVQAAEQAVTFGGRRT